METEAYASVSDEACHTWSRPSAREFVQKHDAGAAYVYFNYGMYWMLNVLVKGGSSDGFVLFRAVEPVLGKALMRSRRLASRRKHGAELRDIDLCSGPGKLAQAFAVTGADHGRDFCGDRDIGIYVQDRKNLAVVSDIRVGISKAKEFEWRFMAGGNSHISVPPSRGLQGIRERG